MLSKYKILGTTNVTFLLCNSKFMCLLTSSSLSQLLFLHFPYFQVFNRDEPEREKLVHVTVKAGDQGKPPLEDVCTIAVKIRDINDNPPIFDRANYDVPVAQVRK